MRSTEKQKKASSHFKASNLPSSEHDEQVTVIEWANLSLGKYPALKLLYAIPNGGARGKAVAGKLKAEGVKKSIPDLCLPVACGGYHALYIEMKSLIGKPSKDQLTLHEELRTYGNKVVVCQGADEGIAELTNYLES